jgi:hypothetical protein
VKTTTSRTVVFVVVGAVAAFTLGYLLPLDAWPAPVRGLVAVAVYVVACAIGYAIERALPTRRG